MVELKVGCIVICRPGYKNWYEGTRNIPVEVIEACSMPGEYKGIYILPTKFKDMPIWFKASSVVLYDTLKRRLACL